MPKNDNAKYKGVQRVHAGRLKYLITYVVFKTRAARSSAVLSGLKYEAIVGCLTRHIKHVLRFFWTDSKTRNFEN